MSENSPLTTTLEGLKAKVDYLVNLVTTNLDEFDRVFDETWAELTSSRKLIDELIATEPDSEVRNQGTQQLKEILVPEGIKPAPLVNARATYNQRKADRAAAETPPPKETEIPPPPADSEPDRPEPTTPPQDEKPAPPSVNSLGKALLHEFEALAKKATTAEDAGDNASQFEEYTALLKRLGPLLENSELREDRKERLQKAADTTLKPLRLRRRQLQEDDEKNLGLKLQSHEKNAFSTEGEAKEAMNQFANAVKVAFLANGVREVMLSRAHSHGLNQVLEILKNREFKYENEIIEAFNLLYDDIERLYLKIRPREILKQKTRELRRAILDQFLRPVRTPAQDEARLKTQAELVQKEAFLAKIEKYLASNATDYLELGEEIKALDPNDSDFAEQKKKLTDNMTALDGTLSNQRSTESILNLEILKLKAWLRRDDAQLKLVAEAKGITFIPASETPDDNQ